MAFKKRKAMFFARPSLTPLNWDFDWLEPDHSYGFNGQRADGRLVYFRYRNGWLKVYLKDAEGKFDFYTPDIETCIGPSHHYRIYLPQLCALLGLTIQGQQVVLDEDALREKEGPLFDWSGRTTHWESCHRLYREDVGPLLDRLRAALPQSRLLIYENDKGSWLERLWAILPRRKRQKTSAHKPWKPMWRERTSYLPPDSGYFYDFAYLVVDYDAKLLNKFLRTQIRPSDSFEMPGAGMKIKLRMAGYATSNKKPNFDRPVPDYDICPDICCLTISATYPTPAPGQPQPEFMQILLALIDQFFCRGYTVVDLETGKVVNAYDTIESFSRAQRQWCLDAPNRYLGAYIGREGDTPVSWPRRDGILHLYGIRPSEVALSALPAPSDQMQATPS